MRKEVDLSRRNERESLVKGVKNGETKNATNKQT